MATSKKLKNWRMVHDDDLCRLILDTPGSSQNTLSASVIAELDSALDDIERAAPAALIIESGKARGFIIGADITEFSALESPAQATEMLARAHRVFNRLEALSMPSVALINGHCLGGGLELALACDYRVACDDRSLRLGLPEVLLGIHPGFGGSVRLIETIGVIAAMTLMLSGRTLAPKAAKRLGMVDLITPSRQLQRVTRDIITQAPPTRRALWKKWHWQGLLNKSLNIAPARAVLAMVLRKRIAARANPAHYSAPYRLIDLWRRHAGDRKAMLEAEQASVAQLITTPTSRNLVKVFFLRDTLKKTGQPKTARKIKGNRKFEHAHIIGAGVMGGDIAAWCALRGIATTLHDRERAALARATRRAHTLFQHKLKSKRLVERAMDRFQPDPDGHGAQHADVIIEAIIENADAKMQLFSEVQNIARADALLATNTSSIPLETLCKSLHASGRLVGLHFFNPVARMQLIEVVKGNKTNAKALNTAIAFAHAIDRLPVTVKSRPGFLVNRILMPYLLEAVELLGEGASGAVIDRAATDFGMPLGPIELADTVGLDVCLHVAQNLLESRGGAVPIALQKKVDAGHLGKKSGHGFYQWTDGKPKKPTSSGKTLADIESRLIFRFLNEAVACLREGVVAQASYLDAGMIFGAGFAPFRGGPINYIVERGQADMLRQLRALHKRYGARFEPDSGWVTMQLGEAADASR